jgi:tetratricopeptide (TPR) repeat protein
MLPVVILYALGLLAKPMLVTLPVLLLLLDYWPLGRFDSGNEKVIGLLKEKIPLFVLAVLSSAVTVPAQRAGAAVASFTALPLSSRVANSLVAYGTYFRKMIWPFDLSILTLYQPIPLWQAILAALTLAATSVWVIRCSKKHPYLFTGWFWYLVAFLPVIGIIQVGTQATADRYTYVPLTGLLILIAWGIPELFSSWRYRRWFLGCAGAVIILGCSILTHFQVETWQDSVSLFAQSIRFNKGQDILFNNVGNQLAEGGRFADAVIHYEAVLRVRPDFAPAHFNLARVFEKLGRKEEAIHHYEEVLKIQPDHAPTKENLARLRGK